MLSHVSRVHRVYLARPLVPKQQNAMGLAMQAVSLKQDRAVAAGASLGSLAGESALEEKSQPI